MPHIEMVHDPFLIHRNLSTIMFLDPEVTAIGLNEQQAQDSRIPYCVRSMVIHLLTEHRHASNGWICHTSGNRRRRYAYTGHARVGRPSSTIIEAASPIMKHDRSVCDQQSWCTRILLLLKESKNVRICFLVLRFINLKYFNLICNYRELHIPISLSEIQESQKTIHILRK